MFLAVISETTTRVLIKRHKPNDIKENSVIAKREDKIFNIARKEIKKNIERYYTQ